MCYVVSFDGDNMSRQNFEHEWEVMRDNIQKRSGPSLTPMKIAEFTLNMIEWRRCDSTRQEELRYIKCGDFTGNST